MLKYSKRIKIDKTRFNSILSRFVPEPIPFIRKISYKKNLNTTFINNDVFNLNNDSVNLISTVKKYGIGSCGPRGFYGTLDLHLDLENKLKSLFNKKDSLLFSNYFTCVESMLQIFGKYNFNVFIDKECNEAIKSNTLLCDGNIIYFTSLLDLSEKLKFINNKIVIIEKLYKKTGKYLDLEYLIKIKEEEGFILILDESYSVPYLYQSINDHNIKDILNKSPKEFSYKDIYLEKDLYKSVEIIIGSFCYGYPSNGGFICTDRETKNFIELKACSYVFSASLPAVLAQANLNFINKKINYEKVIRKIKVAHKYFLNIISDVSCPFLVLRHPKYIFKKDTVEINKKKYKIEKIKDLIKIKINENIKKDLLIKLSKIINKWSK